MKKTLGNNLKKLLEDNDLQNKDLANYLQVKEQTVSGYTTDKHAMSIENLIKAADYFNCSTDYLLGRVETPKILTGTKEDYDILELIKKLEISTKTIVIMLLKNIGKK